MDKIKVLLRSGLFFLLFASGTILFSSIILAVIPVTTAAQRRRLIPTWGRFNRNILAFFCGLTVRVIGLENLPPPPYMILCKHQSAWETVVLQAFFPGAVLVLKKSLLNIPIFGWAMKATEQIAIDRSQGVSALRLMTTKCREAFEAGRTVLIFPEGTRVAVGEVGKYNPGGVGMALSSNVPIVPVAHNAGQYWGRKTFIIYPGEMQLRIGPSIPTVGLGKGDRKQINIAVQDSIEGMMSKISDS